MLTLQAALKPPPTPHDPARLAFSPDGAALLASTGNQVQVWPRWLDGPPRPVVSVVPALERVALTPDGARAFLYLSGNSRVEVLDVATGAVEPSKLPREDPVWFHFDAAGGFALVCRGRGALARYDYAPKLKKRFREAWAIDRLTADADPEERQPLGSHYRFGAIGGAAGVFVTLEYVFSGFDEPFHGLTVRAVTDGSVLHHQPLDGDEAEKLVTAAGLSLAVHPSGRYMAYPHEGEVRLHALAAGVKVPAAVPKPPAPPVSKGKKAKPDPTCHAVAFHPNGALLAAAGDDQMVTLYDTTTWAAVRTFAWKVGRLRAVCFSADGTRAAALSASGKVVVWDVDV